MNVTSTLPAIVDAPAAPGQGKGESDHGQVFDLAIRNAARDAAKDAASRAPSHADAGAAREEPATAKPDARDQTAPAVGGAPVPKVAAKDGGKASTHKKTGEDEATSDGDGEGQAAGGASATSDLLGQLLAVSDAARLGSALPGVDQKAVNPTAVDPKAGDGAAKAVAADGALSERLVITPLSLIAGDGADAVDPTATAAGKVKLDVLHMETHFEPHADDFVLVEGGAKAAAATRTTAEAAPVKSSDLKLSFDEALARLSEQQASLAKDSAGADAGSSGSNKGGSETHGGRSGNAATTLKAVRDGTADLSVAARASSLAVAGEGADEASAATLASMTSQIASHVLDALGASGSSTPASNQPTGDAYIRMKAGGAALKTLTIQLQPENLGTLDVSMRLVDGQLTLELAASQHDTARVLAADRGGLKKLLEHAGFSMDDASISIVTRDASASPLRASASGSTDGGGMAQRDGAQRDGSGQNGSGDPREAARRASTRQDESGRPASVANDGTARPRGASRNVYL